MMLTLKQLKNLPVYTKNNDYLGRIKDLEINNETQTITNYLVKNFQVTKKLQMAELVINANQVISLDEQKMVVEDSVIKEEGLIKELATV